MYHLFHLKVEILSALKIVLYRKGGLRHDIYGTRFNMVPETTRCSKLHLNNKVKGTTHQFYVCRDVIG